MSLDYEYLFRYAGIIAAERTHGNPSLFEDVRQEAMIAAWEADRDNPGKPPEYARAALKNGSMRLLRGRPHTGSDGKQGWQDAFKGAGPIEDQYGTPIPVPDRGVAERLEALDETADVLAAVAELDPGDREIVFGRYWLGERFSDIAERTGRKTGTLSRRWTETIRPALAERLAHAA